ncbi:MAG: hypothetical protein WC955_09540 [Elusimicrobiota bacterium]
MLIRKLGIFFAVFALCILSAGTLFAEPQTLIGGKLEDNGGYGGPSYSFSTLNGKSAMFVGGQGGWVANHTITIGGAGYGLTSNIRGTDLGLNTTNYLSLGYGGVMVEYIIFSDVIVHATVRTLFGWGGVGLYHRGMHTGSTTDVEDTDNGFFNVIEPSVQAEVNITNFFRINLGVGYRYIPNLDYEGLKGNALDGLSAHFVLKFGKF